MNRSGPQSALVALIASLSPLVAGQAFAQASVAASVETHPITPPMQPMIYTRRLERSLVGDAQIVVERKFAIHFVPLPTGYRVEGHQIAVEVQTPEQLASLAQLERERVEGGIFPLELDREGRIMTGEVGPEAPEIDEALRDIDARLDALKPSEDERQILLSFVEAIHAAGASIVSRMPQDLFAPLVAERTDSRAIALPQGGEGEVSTVFSARRDLATGLMSSARREVVSAIAGSSRRTVETFTLEPDAPKLSQGIIIPSREGA